MENINSEKTISNFGYKPSDLKSNSCKLVIWICEDCKTEKNKIFRDAIKHKRCLKCSNKLIAQLTAKKRSDKMVEYYKNNIHPLKITKRPQHVIDALNKSREERVITDDYRSAMSLRNTGVGNPFYGKRHTKETIEKLKQSQQKKVRRGKDSNFYGKQFHSKGEWFTCIDGSKVWMRSSWEIKVAKYLNSNNIQWLFEPKIFEITYNNKEGTYKPDFFLLKENKFIEVKGWWRDDARIKYDAFRIQYPDIMIELYDKEKLKTLKIL